MNELISIKGLQLPLLHFRYYCELLLYNACNPTICRHLFHLDFAAVLLDFVLIHSVENRLSHCFEPVAFYILLDGREYNLY